MDVMRKGGMQSLGIQHVDSPDENDSNTFSTSVDVGYGARLCTLCEGDSFGEAALINEANRNATLCAREHTELMVLHRTDFMDVLADMTKAVEYNAGRIMKILDIECDLRSDVDVETLMGLGKTVAFFQQFSDDLLRELCRVMTVIKPQYGECICRQGEPAECLYILLQGAASVHVKTDALNEASNTNQIAGMNDRFTVTRTLGCVCCMHIGVCRVGSLFCLLRPCVSNLLKGDCFGEKGLHDVNSLRSASVVCQADHSRLITLSKVSYLEHLAAPNRLIFAPGLSQQALMKLPV